MNHKREKKILSCYLDKLDQKGQPFIASFTFKFIVWLAVVALLVILLQLHKAGDIHIVVLLSVSLFAGCALGFTILLQTGYKQWPYLKPHINRDSIKERIEELNT